MRWPVAAIILLLLPTASAATQVHATFLGDAYSVTFVSNATDASVPVAWEGGEASAVRVSEPAGDADRIYRAKLPATALRYTVEGRTFSLPSPPSAHASTRVVFVADMGTDANASLVLAGILREKPSLVLMGGDLSYANGDARVWDRWFELVEPLAANAPLMPAYGNHEDYCADGDRPLHHCGPDSNAWHAHFALPNGDKLYYAFDWGPLHVTVLDTEAYASGDAYTDGAAQEAFFNESLGEAGGRWNVLMYHRPIRTTNSKEGLDTDETRAALETLVDGRADLVLQAHAHAYERENPRNGTTFVTSGGGGRSLYDEWAPMDPRLAKRAAEFHFLVLDASDARIAVRAIRPDGSTLDEFALERDAPAPTPTTPPITAPTIASAGTPDPTGADVTPNGSNGSGPVAETNTPGPGLVALALVLTLSARLKRGRVVRL